MMYHAMVCLTVPKCKNAQFVHLFYFLGWLRISFAQIIRDVLNYISRAIMQEFLYYYYYYFYYLFVEIDQSLQFYKRIQSDAFMASVCTRRTKFVQLSSCSPWRVFAEFSSLTCLHAFTNSNDLRSTSFW